MTREQAINYLASSGMTDEQIAEIVTAIERTETHACDCGKKETHGDVIYRQCAIEALDKRFDDIPMELTTEILLLRNDLRERIPSAEPEVIRCKECEWWEKQKDSVQGRCALMQMYPAGGWYCGNARRREGEDE